MQCKPLIRPCRILIVDDDELQLRAIQRTSRKDPRIEVAVVSNAIDGLIHVGAMRPDVVVLDVFMPGLDGIEACRRIKANPETRDTKVILASASMNAELEAVARQVGASGTTLKPIDLASLLESPREAVADRVVVANPTTIRGADLLVNMLAEAGVEWVFGLPGGAISPVHDALLDSSVRTITTRHESGAMFAAAGYAHATGKLAVVAVTSGPGCLNAMTGLASAWCDGLPVLLLVGEVPRHAHGKGVLQDGSSHGLQLVEMARHVTKLAAEVPRASALPHLLRRAIATALSGRKGPVMLTLPIDVMTAQVSMPKIGGAVTIGETLEPSDLDELAQLLQTAQRPLILAGSGVRGAGAPAKLRQVAERLRCPVATTPKGKGVFPENHALALGVLGMGGHRSARAYLDSGVDVVVAIGTSLGEMATDGFAPQLQASGALVHIDIDARQIGKSYAPTHAIVASASSLLGGLIERFDHAPPATPSSALRELVGGVERQVLPSSTKPDRIAPHDALLELQRLLPEDTIYTVDAGEHFLFAVQYLTSIHPDSFMVMTGLGSMGQSIGAAMGAQLANPNRSVAAICGDGCFAMNAFEIATAVAEQLSLRVFVFNDGHLGMVEKGHETVYGRRPKYSTGALDVCSIARGLGASTFLVDHVGQLSAMQDMLHTTTGPVVVDVRIDSAISLTGKDRVAAMSPAVAPPKFVPPAVPQPVQLVN